MDQETLDLLALSLIPGLGTTRLNRLVATGQTAGEILQLSRNDLGKLGFSLELQVYIASGCPMKEAEKAATTAEKKRIRILSILSGRYPELLRQIYDSPIILYVLGSIDCLHQPSLAIVGSRRCSIYGREVTQKLSRELASLGLNIVSGMARGVDSQAHQGALSVEGTTTAILGNGIDVVYPRENKRLYDLIQETGCLVSEFPIGSYPAPQNFPVRNRIISGLCFGTLIPEAAEFSGSLITARLTLEQDRELWAVPGNITGSTSYGPNYLIKQGAKPVLTAQDIVDDLPLHVLNLLDKEKPKTTAKESPTLSQSEQKLIGLLSPDESIHFDQLLENLDLTIPELSAALLSLEMKELIRQEPGKRFSKRL
jgi:DNA processing protein